MLNLRTIIFPWLEPITSCLPSSRLVATDVMKHESELKCTSKLWASEMLSFHVAIRWSRTTITTFCRPQSKAFDSLQQDSKIFHYLLCWVDWCSVYLFDWCTPSSIIFRLYDGSQRYNERKPGSAREKPTTIRRWWGFLPLPAGEEARTSCTLTYTALRTDSGFIAH